MKALNEELDGVRNELEEKRGGLRALEKGQLIPALSFSENHDSGLHQLIHV
jgi:hypothetical protein